MRKWECGQKKGRWNTYYKTRHLFWTDEDSLPLNDRMELYFEDFDIDRVLARSETDRYFARYATGL